MAFKNKCNHRNLELSCFLTTQLFWALLANLLHQQVKTSRIWSLIRMRPSNRAQSEKKGVPRRHKPTSIASGHPLLTMASMILASPVTTTLVSHIDSDILDHLPILLKCHPRQDERSARKKRFMFENMWFTEPACKDVVAMAWSFTSHANAVDNLLARLNYCSNKSSFGNVKQQIRELEQCLKSQRDAISRHQTLSLIRDWRTKEEILWWQRA
ncbi:hypothetical protein Cgig2_029289 [Carnegiea gigantea]|uniref:Uncharacterized protein n=1 Tax=Carnegiea gigantea TaxID=171969 RepID=A0A9Q1KWL3_9CARY|nr:hypothetical protein Cgig2_029289 [Carnegiea gigantea]